MGGGGKVTLLQSIETKRFNWEICPPRVTITQGGAFFVVKNLRSPKKFQKISESSKKFRKKSCGASNDCKECSELSVIV